MTHRLPEKNPTVEILARTPVPQSNTRTTITPKLPFTPPPPPTHTHPTHTPLERTTVRKPYRPRSDDALRVISLGSHCVHYSLSNF